jgi:hypothetical protein
MIAFPLFIVAVVVGSLLFKGFFGGVLIGLLMLFSVFVLARLFD